MRFYVYGYFDPESGEPFYIGKGNRRRAYAHLTACNRPKHCCYNTFFYRKLRKMLLVGIEPHIKIISDQLSEKEALEFEKSEIKRIGRRSQGEGTLCNLGQGGDSSGMSGHKHSEESKQKMSKSQTGRFVSMKTRQKLSKANTGKKASKETRQKMRMARLGKPRKDLLGRKASEETKQRMRETHLRRPVSCFDVDGNLIDQFETIKAVAEKGFISCCVSNCLAGNQKTHGGFYWKYSNIELVDIEHKKSKKNHYQKKYHFKPVNCFDTDEKLVHQFDSISVVIDKGYSRTCVSACLNGRQKTHKGLYWRYSHA